MLAIKFSVLALVIAAILDVVTANDGSNPSGLLELPQGKTCTDIPNAECDKYAECEYDEVYNDCDWFDDEKYVQLHG